ncbi:serine--glyoxylate aminotransferase, partial [bacterium]|nr:serine--glyoxylate aminotransferase [bacterium]
MPHRPGHHFLHIPGPTPLPERISRAIARPTIDHRGPDFARLTLGIVERLQEVFGTRGAIAIYPSSGTGAWEAALVNALSPGDRVLFCINGQFAAQWS